MRDVPPELQALPQWVCWRYGAARADGKRPKLPVDPRTGRAAKPNKPATWATFDEAAAAVVRFGAEGVGFMFADGGGLCGLDFDDCIVGGELVPEVVDELRVLASYAEISPSGGGVKVILKGTKPAGIGCKVENVLGCSRVEVYDRLRFFACTGNRWPGMPATVEPRQAELEALCRRLWPGKQVDGVQRMHCTTGEPVVGGDGAELSTLERCRRYVAKMPDAISGEGGSDATMAVACTCFRFGLNDDDAWTVLNEYNAAKCTPAWSENELRHKLADAELKVRGGDEWGILLAKPLTGKRWHNALPGWIRKLKLRPHRYRVLEVIASRCHKEPVDAYGSLAGAYIGYDDLAAEAVMCRRTAINHVRTLCGEGLLVLVERGGIDFTTGECRANEYRIPGKFGALDGVQNVHPNTTGLHGGGQCLHPVREANGRKQHSQPRGRAGEAA